MTQVVLAERQGRDRGWWGHVEAPVAMRIAVEGGAVPGDLVSYTRLSYRLERRAGAWRILSLDAVYEYATLTPSVPGQVIEIPPEDLSGYRPSYAVLAWNVAREGRPPAPDQLGDDRPQELAAFYASVWRWLGAAEEKPAAELLRVDGENSDQGWVS